jgi:putative chitobiose transport system permease protein
MNLKSQVNKLNLNKLTPYLFLLPALLAFGITSFLPIIQAFYLSLTNYDFITKPSFIGWQNYISLWSDRLFWQVLLNTLIYLVCAVPLLIIIPLFLAILVNQKLRGIQFFRVIYYFPVVISVVVAGLAWKWIYAENGLLNYFVSLFGSIKINWLTDASTAIFAVIAVTVWKGLGYYMVIYLAGLQSISQDLYEAAAIDGSDGWIKHFDITIPLLKPYIILVAVMASISAMKVFEEVFIMSRGGPANSTKTIVYYLYEKGFGSLEMGYASAIGIVIFGGIFLVSVATFRFINSPVNSPALAIAPTVQE